MYILIFIQLFILWMFEKLIALNSCSNALLPYIVWVPHQKQGREWEVSDMIKSIYSEGKRSLLKVVNNNYMTWFFEETVLASMKFDHYLCFLVLMHFTLFYAIWLRQCYIIMCHIWPWGSSMIGHENLLNLLLHTPCHPLSVYLTHTHCFTQTLALIFLF